MGLISIIRTLSILDLKQKNVLRLIFTPCDLRLHYNNVPANEVLDWRKVLWELPGSSLSSFVSALGVDDGMVMVMVHRKTRHWTIFTWTADCLMLSCRGQWTHCYRYMIRGMGFYVLTCSMKVEIQKKWIPQIKIQIGEFQLWNKTIQIMQRAT